MSETLDGTVFREGDFAVAFEQHTKRHHTLPGWAATNLPCGVVCPTCSKSQRAAEAALFKAEQELDRVGIHNARERASKFGVGPARLAEADAIEKRLQSTGVSVVRYELRLVAVASEVLAAATSAEGVAQADLKRFDAAIAAPQPKESPQLAKYAKEMRLEMTMPSPSQAAVHRATQLLTAMFASVGIPLQPYRPRDKHGLILGPEADALPRTSLGFGRKPNQCGVCAEHLQQIPEDARPTAMGSVASAAVARHGNRWEQDPIHNCWQISDEDWGYMGYEVANLSDEDEDHAEKDGDYEEVPTRGAFSGIGGVVASSGDPVKALIKSWYERHSEVKDELSEERGDYVDAVQELIGVLAEHAPSLASPTGAIDVLNHVDLDDLPTLFWVLANNAAFRKRATSARSRFPDAYFSGEGDTVDAVLEDVQALLGDFTSKKRVRGHPAVTEGQQAAQGMRDRVEAMLNAGRNDWSEWRAKGLTTTRLGSECYQGGSYIYPGQVADEMFAYVKEGYEFGQPLIRVDLDQDGTMRSALPATFELYWAAVQQRCPSYQPTSHDEQIAREVYAELKSFKTLDKTKVKKILRVSLPHMLVTSGHESTKRFEQAQVDANKVLTLWHRLVLGGKKSSRTGAVLHLPGFLNTPWTACQCNRTAKSHGPFGRASQQL